MMTADEIIAIAKATETAEPGTDGYILPVSFARAIENAVIVKLCAGVEMQEPAAYAGKTQAGKWKYTTGSIGSAKTWLLYQEREYLTKGLQIVPLFTADQLQIAIAAARVKALEDAALNCEELHWTWRMGDNSGPKECAEKIRTLKGGAA